MSFVTVLALAVAAFVAAPMLAHLLRRGRAREQAFPPAALVPDARATTRERSRLEDRGLLLLRAAMIVCLALLGAGPLVRCSRVSLGRAAGASVAIALVVDDSASMRTQLRGGKSRFQRALEGAQELLTSAREGDAVALILAGKPARIALAAGTDLGAARHALSELKPSDRATDLAGAVGLARATLASLPHRDKRIVLLSDLAGDVPAETGSSIWTPLPELAEPADDCGVVRAARNGLKVSVDVACSNEATSTGRSLSLLSDGARTGAEARLLRRAGVQTVNLDAPAGFSGVVALSGQDQNPADDRAEVAPEATSLSLAVQADATREAVVTGGPPLLEQALHSLALELPVRPLPELPREAAELADVAALFIDDAAGFTPETRGALDSWLETGAVATLFLGAAHDTQLGSTLEPFVRGAVGWEAIDAQAGAEPGSFTWLGAEAESLRELNAKGRARLDTVLLPGAAIVGRWQDGKALVSRQERGRGLVFSVGLPVSADVSDLALRPGFLALLDHIVGEALKRRGPRESPAGTEWSFPAASAVQVTGPAGAVASREADGQRISVPDVTGRYQVSVAGKSETRFVTLPPEEVLTPPRRDLPSEWKGPRAAGAPAVDASPELGWVVLVLLGLELVVRLFRLVRERRQGAQAAADLNPTKAGA